MHDISDVMSSAHNSVVINTIKQTLSEYIKKNFILGEDEHIGTDVSLVASGIMDLASALELAQFIETTYTIKVPDLDINPDNLETIERIAHFVASRIRMDT